LWKIEGEKRKEKKRKTEERRQEATDVQMKK